MAHADINLNPIERAQAVVAEAGALLAKPAADLPDLWAAILDDYQRRDVATCLRLIRENHGCSTPFSEFFCRLLTAAEDGAPEPDHVQGYLDEYRENQADALRDAAVLLRNHPKTFAAAFATLTGVGATDGR